MFPGRPHFSDRINRNDVISDPLSRHAAFEKKVEDNNAILGESTHKNGVIGRSANGIGVYADAPTAVLAISNTDNGIGVMGVGRQGVVGESDSFQGVYGHSKTNAGVVGESNSFDGLWGISHNAEKAGVFGLNKNGYGVIGHSETKIGVSGDSNSGIGVHGKGGELAAFFEGDVKISGVIRLENADCAEDFDIEDETTTEPGTVVVLGPQGMLSQSRKVYDKRVAGIISGAGKYKPGIVLDKNLPEHKNGRRMPLALIGKAYCKVDAQYGAIEVGDMLTTSPTTGHAMKASDVSKAFGSIIGKALCSLEEGKGLIPVLVTLQ